LSLVQLVKTSNRRELAVDLYGYSGRTTTSGHYQKKNQDHLDAATISLGKQIGVA
jgi:hypothetical protein